MSDNNQEFDEMEAADQLQQQKNQAASAIKDAATDVMSRSVSMGTSTLLRSSWESIATVVGFLFLGLPYINFHVFMHFVLPKDFCNLGEEWVPAQFKQYAQSFGQGTILLTIIEWIALIILDIAVLSIILVNLWLFYIIVDYVMGLFDGWFGFFLKHFVFGKNADDTSIPIAP